MAEIISLKTWTLLLYWSQDGDASLLELYEQVSGLHTSCRQPKEEEHCWRHPAAITAPSLNCRRYGWKRESAGPRPSVPDSELMTPSALCLRCAAAVFKLNVLVSFWNDAFRHLQPAVGWHEDKTAYLSHTGCCMCKHFVLKMNPQYVISQCEERDHCPCLLKICKDKSVVDKYYWTATCESKHSCYAFFYF